MSGKLFAFLVFCLALAVLGLVGLGIAQEVSTTAEALAWREQAQAVQSLGHALQIQAVGNIIGLCLLGLLALGGMAASLFVALAAVRKGKPTLSAEDIRRITGSLTNRPELPGREMLDADSFAHFVRECDWWPK